MDHFVLISGCSGGGKSTLLSALARLGHPTVEEPGRRIVGEEVASGGEALPWVNEAAFARRAIRLSLADRQASIPLPGWVFFDRGLIDAASALEHLTGKPFLRRFSRRHRYHRTVFLAPPWPAIYGRDEARRHGFEKGVEEYRRLLDVYPALGYELCILPKVSISARASFVLEVLGRA